MVYKKKAISLVLCLFLLSGCGQTVPESVTPEPQEPREQGEDIDVDQIILDAEQMIEDYWADRQIIYEPEVNYPVFPTGIPAWDEPEEPPPAETAPVSTDEPAVDGEEPSRDEPEETPPAVTEPVSTDEPETDGEEPPQDEPEETPPVETGPAGAAEGDAQDEENEENDAPDSEIKLSYEYVMTDGLMPYGLFTPSTARDNESTPLIVWLHGAGEVGVNADTFRYRGLVAVLNDWELHGFDAYVLCPHLNGNGYSEAWNNDFSQRNLEALIAHFLEKYRVDESRIAIMGHSSGGQGAIYMSQRITDRFSSLTVMSGYSAGTAMTDTSIPARGYVGTLGAHEDQGSINYMNDSFVEYFGGQGLTILECAHGEVPRAAFNIDEDGNGSSDLIEWCLAQARTGQDMLA